MNTRDCAALELALALAVALHTTLASAQAAAPTDATRTADARDAAELGEVANQSRPMPETIGGMPEPPRGYEYTSPLKTFGTDLGVGSYAIGALVAFVYLVAVFPTQALLGNGKPEPVLLWMLLPIVGPWMAQYEPAVKDKIVWRAVLIGDASLQATGLIVGLIGAALSGKRTRPATPSTSLELRVSGLGLSMSLHTL
jgi:hypothetical protein